MGKNYSNVAVETTLSSGVTSGATSLTVAATTGFPSPDFTLVLDPGTVSEELVLVTGVGGTTLTVTRGYDGTTAVSHDAGAVVRHVHSAKDFKDSRDHEAATAAHGATGAVVGTTNTQTLTNKTLTSPTINSPSVTGLTLDGKNISGEWAEYTPTVTNATTSTSSGRYVQVGKRVDVMVGLALSGTPSGVVSVSLPVAANTALSTGQFAALSGAAWGTDVGVAFHHGVPVLMSSTTVSVGVPGTGNLWSGASPVSWSSGDTWRLSFSYEAA